VPDLLDSRMLTSVVPKVAAAAFHSGVAGVALEPAAYSAQLKALAESLG
jgi:malate dehydrogenase (oxaloacetate-decarboxylating)(NADP+)